ncbi:ASAH2 ceramidase, partial [Atractosteus spatula]|nr:ASAH2 ceramidase [Atractosteus spatula]
MARKVERGVFSTLEVFFLVLFVLMTGVVAGLAVVMAVDWNREKSHGKLDPSQMPPKTSYLIGVGRADCTGPVADIPLVLYVCIASTTILSDGLQRIVILA